MTELAEVVAELAEYIARRDGQIKGNQHCPFCGVNRAVDTYMGHQWPHDEHCLVSRAERLAREGTSPG
jgi:hypothetical protein